MLEKPKRPVKPNIQDRLQPTTVEELIRKYDLENKGVYDFLDKIVDYINSNASEQKEVTISEVLWENSNPSNEMGEGFEIILNSSDYDYLEWFYIYSNAEANLKTQGSSSCMKGCTAMLSDIGYGTNLRVRRKLEYVSDIKYKATIAHNESSDSATHLIPVKAIGYKKLIKI